MLGVRATALSWAAVACYSLSYELHDFMHVQPAFEI